MSPATVLAPNKAVALSAVIDRGGQAVYPLVDAQDPICSHDCNE
jgi:hypothetical protein